MLQPIRSMTQIWIVLMKHHQYGISVLYPQTSFGGENSGALKNLSCLLRLPLSKIVLFQKISTLHSREFPGLQPPPPLHSFFKYFGILQLPPSKIPLTFHQTKMNIFWNHTMHRNIFQIPPFHKSQT